MIDTQDRALALDIMRGNRDMSDADVMIPLGSQQYHKVINAKKGSVYLILYGIFGQLNTDTGHQTAYYQVTAHFYDGINTEKDEFWNQVLPGDNGNMRYSYDPDKALHL